MKVVRNGNRPSIRMLVVVLAVVAAIVAVGVVFDQNLIASVSTMLICLAVIAWSVVRGMRQA